ncbi:MaoC family dehydratase [Nocardia sp. NPDC004750]
MTCFSSIEELRQSVDADLGVSRWIDIDQQRIDTFAETTEDRQWIHTDPEAATHGPYGTTIAHGFMTLSLIAAFLEDLLIVENVDMAINYGLNKVRFPAPVPVGSRVRAHGRITAADPVPGGVQVAVAITIECDGTDKPVCVAESLSRFLVRPT